MQAESSLKVNFQQGCLGNHYKYLVPEMRTDDILLTDNCDYIVFNEGLDKNKCRG